MIILQIALILVLPVLLFRLERQMRWLKSIVMAYVLGVIIGNVDPDFFDHGMLKELTGISIILAIPLMLFSSNIKMWIQQPRKLLLAYVLAVVATSTSVAIGWFIFQDGLENLPLISGMIEGVYTGGTVNLNAVGYAFEAPEEMMVLLNGYDMAFSGVYLLFIFTFLPAVLKFILKSDSDIKNEVRQEDEVDFFQLAFKEQLLSIGKGVGLSALILGSVVGIAILLTGKMHELIIIFGVTGLALIGSNFKNIQGINGNMVMADYFMIIFGFTLGAQANVAELLSGHLDIFKYFAVIYSTMLTIHLILAKIFKIDVNAFLISSTAAIFGPPFIGPVAESLNRRNLIAPGIIIALMGNAIGTYLGILVVQILS